MTVIDWKRETFDKALFDDLSFYYDVFNGYKIEYEDIGFHYISPLSIMQNNPVIKLGFTVLYRLKPFTTCETSFKGNLQYTILVKHLMHLFLLYRNCIY